MELGPEMKSTGESIYFIDDLMDDYFLDVYNNRNLYLSRLQLNQSHLKCLKSWLSRCWRRWCLKRKHRHLRLRQRHRPARIP